MIVIGSRCLTAQISFFSGEATSAVAWDRSIAASLECIRNARARPEGSCFWDCQVPLSFFTAALGTHTHLSVR